MKVSVQSRVKSQRRTDSAGFVLHTYPYKETSLIIEAFTKDLGRVSLVAKGAKRPNSMLRGVILPFQPLELEWSGKNELKNLYRAEWLGGYPVLRGLPLICGFYMNELLINLLPKDDPYEKLFQQYTRSVGALGDSEKVSVILRKFEKNLLKELGYQLKLDKEGAQDSLIDPSVVYTYDPELGPVRIQKNQDDSFAIHGKTLSDIDKNDFTDPRTLYESKQLMRHMIQHHLGDKVLHSRQLLMEYKDF